MLRKNVIDVYSDFNFWFKLSSHAIWFFTTKKLLSVSDSQFGLCTTAISDSIVSQSKTYRLSDNVPDKTKFEPGIGTGGDWNFLTTAYKVSSLI